MDDCEASTPTAAAAAAATTTSTTATLPTLPPECELDGPVSPTDWIGPGAMDCRNKSATTQNTGDQGGTVDTEYNGGAL